MQAALSAPASCSPWSSRIFVRAAKTVSQRRSAPWRLACRASQASAKPEAGPSAAVAATPSQQPGPVSAAKTALAYYDAYNAKRIDRVMELIAEDCVYEDLIYHEPFVGRAAIAAYFKKVESLVPPDIKFVVEDISESSGRKAGVRWHVELDGIEFPFSRGVSFYEVNEAGQIVFARDCVEPTFKPGGAALKGISLVAPLVRKLGPKANPATLKQLPLAAAGMWALYAAYFGYVMLSTSAPGSPVWQTTPEMLQPVIHESANFFYINIGLAQLGLNPVPSVAEHPVDEALFNLMNAWSLMFWPAMLADPKGERVANRLPLWIGTMFLTNVFMFPYMCLRLAPDSEASGQGQPAASASAAASAAADGAAATAQGFPRYGALLGAVGGMIGAISLAWAAAARPEFGGLPERLDFFQTMFSTNRVFWAFCVDACFYSVWQAVLLGAAGAPAQYRFVPFAGLAAWLLKGGPVQR